MKKVVNFFASIVIIMMFLLSQVHAQIYYISDELEVPVRAGGSDRFKIIKMLKSGTPVKVLEANKSTGYSLVRAEEQNIQGWIYTRYLMNEPSARNYIQEAKTQYEPTRLKLVELEQQLLDAHKIENDLKAHIQQLAETIKTQNDELENIKQVSANVVEIHEKNKQLTTLTADLNQRLTESEFKQQNLANEVKTREWIVGSSIFGLGMFLGLVVLPRLRFRPKHNQWDHY